MFSYLHLHNPVAYALLESSFRMVSSNALSWFSLLSLPSFVAAKEALIEFRSHSSSICLIAELSWLHSKAFYHIAFDVSFVESGYAIKYT
ncbi:hypothetical protein JTE90_029414 [Oedothorax gibbosus]|uniref:Uncharacterized protein n=1 Tax=Oedothorax gibbosus TaxID=931172 RepID=A0AAV6TQ48_9ARAC|nr:hypothetical protein JTE90_029414 [Oedothorax gibbosus]